MAGQQPFCSPGKARNAFWSTRTRGDALATQERIAAEGGESSVFEADFTDFEQCRAFVDACVDRYGTVDILDCNAGTAHGDKPVLDIAVEDFDFLMDVNLKGVLLSCKAVLPQMIKQRSGSIVMISSI